MVHQQSAAAKSSRYQTSWKQGLALMSHLSSRDLPDEIDLAVNDSSSLLEAFANGCDTRGRWPHHLVLQLFWWVDPMPDNAKIMGWVDELIQSGDLRSDYLGVDCYSGNRIPILTLLRRGRHERFSERTPIPASLRAAVYERDGHRCLHCGSDQRLSLDHIHPYSLGVRQAEIYP